MYIRHLSTGVPVLLLRVFTLLLGSRGGAGGGGEHIGIRAHASRHQKDGLTAHTGGFLKLVQAPQPRQVRLGTAVVYLLVKNYFHALPHTDTGASLLITSLGDE